MPTNTDLVSQLPADFEVFGQAVDTSLADLKGGTTGQVLSKNSNTDMDFVWVTSDDANAIQNTIVDAKGDLIGATAADTPARLAVGTNGQVLTADSTAATGLAWATPSGGSSYVAGKNGVINGAFDNWQRGTSGTFTGTIAYPAADRFFGICTGTAPTCTMSRQTADTTGLTYGMRFGRNSGQTNTGAPYVGTAFESIDSKRFAGQTVTLSFYVKSGADAPTSLVSQIRTGTGTDESAASLFSVGWTGGLNNSQTNTVSTTMTRYTQTVTLGSTVNQIMLLFTYTPTGTAGANEWFQIEGVQLEIAGSASAFSRNTGAQATELAACQRYFANVVPSTADYGTVISMFQAVSSSAAKGGIRFPVPMRVSASITLANANNFTLANSSYTPIGGSSFTYAVGNTVDCRIDMSVASGLTAGNATALSGNTSNLLIQASAEL